MSAWGLGELPNDLSITPTFTSRKKGVHSPHREDPEKHLLHCLTPTCQAEHWEQSLHLRGGQMKRTGQATSSLGPDPIGGGSRTDAFEDTLPWIQNAGRQGDRRLWLLGNKGRRGRKVYLKRSVLSVLVNAVAAGHAELVLGTEMWPGGCRHELLTSFKTSKSNTDTVDTLKHIEVYLEQLGFVNLFFSKLNFLK